MTLMRVFGCAALLAGIVGVSGTFSTAQDAAASADELAAKAWTVIEKNCYKCHGQDPDPAKHKQGLNLKNPAVFTKPLKSGKTAVVPKKPDESAVITRVESADDDERMPPGKQLSEADRKTLRDWIAAGAPAFGGSTATKLGAGKDDKPTLPADAPSGTPAAPDQPLRAEKKPLTAEEKAALTASVKTILKNNCATCHGDVKPKAGINVLDHAALVKEAVTPGNSDQSRLYQALAHADGVSPMPQGRPQLSFQQIDAVRKWIAAGAPGPFPQDEKIAADKVGEKYILGAILTDFRSQPANRRTLVRYFSINHLLARGATRDELNLYTEALGKAINHLTWAPSIVKPEPIEETKTVFRVDISELGWETRPFVINSGADKDKASTVNLYDLVLLEYPYGMLDTDSPEAEQLLREFLQPSGGDPIQVRPVPYVRGDWFCSVATSSPLYEDLLQLPFKLKADRDANGQKTGKDGLEDRLGVNTEANILNSTAKRAGVTVSGVSRNNRVLERHRTSFGAYWKSFDSRSSKGTDNMFRDPINFTFAGGEMVFTLPNGTMGYFVCDSSGKRLEAAPTDIVVDANASDKVVRNGLACIRCHDSGVKTGFKDDINVAVQQIRFLQPGLQKQVLELYPGQAEINKLLKLDQERFINSMKELLGSKPTREPLTPVTQQFIDGALDIATVAAELGQKNKTQVENMFQGKDLMSAGMYQLGNNGAVRRDTFEEFYDKAARRFGTPIVPVDALTRRDFDPDNPGFEVEFKNNQRVFKPGENLELTITNKSSKQLFIEVVFTDDSGVRGVLLAPEALAANTPKVIRQAIKAGAGKSQVTLFASDKQFDAAQLLRVTKDRLARGEDVFDRLVHKSFYKFDFDSAKNTLKLSFDPGQQLFKKTLDVETQ
jgi:mono/diheme cytochrome c family protein